MINKELYLRCPLDHRPLAHSTATGKGITGLADSCKNSTSEGKYLSLAQVQKNNQASTKGCLLYYIPLLNVSLVSFIKITVCMCFIQVKLSFHQQTSAVQPIRPTLEIAQVKENNSSKETSQLYYLIFLKYNFCVTHMLCP